MVPGGIGQRPGYVRCARAERCAERQHRGSDEQEDDLGAKATLAKVLSRPARGQDGPEREERDREERGHGKVRDAEEKEVLILEENAHVESVEALDDAGDEDNDHADGDHIVRREQRREPLCPAQVRVRCPIDALDEDDIDEEEYDDAHGDEDLGPGQL